MTVLEQYCKEFINELVFDQLLSQSNFSKLLTLSHQPREFPCDKLVLFIAESLHFEVFRRHNKVLYLCLKLKVDNHSEWEKHQRHYLSSHQLLESLLRFIDMFLFIDYSLFWFGILSRKLTKDQHSLARLLSKKELCLSCRNHFNH